MCRVQSESHLRGNKPVKCRGNCYPENVGSGCTSPQELEAMQEMTVPAGVFAYSGVAPLKQMRVKQSISGMLNCICCCTSTAGIFKVLRN